MIRAMDGPPCPQFVYFIVNQHGEVVSRPYESREAARRDGMHDQWRVRRAKLTLYGS